MKNYKTSVCNRVAVCLAAAKQNEKLMSVAAKLKKYGKAAFPALAFIGVNLLFGQVANAQGPIFFGRCRKSLEHHPRRIKTDGDFAFLSRRGRSGVGNL